MASPSPFPAQSKIPASLIGSATRHAFLCLGPDCCHPDLHAPLWDLLKTECKALNVPVLRSKAACLRICSEGPWLVIYPYGIWYGRLSPDRLRRIVREHLGAGRPVREWIAADTPNLCSPAKASSHPPRP